VPIHKKNDRLDMENYRPVSVQTIIKSLKSFLLIKSLQDSMNG